MVANTKSASFPSQWRLLSLSLAAVAILQVLLPEHHANRLLRLSLYSLLAVSILPLLFTVTTSSKNETAKDTQTSSQQDDKHSSPAPLLPCIRARRSVFPRDYIEGETVSRKVMERLLEAAMWAPFHGPSPPWRFVVMGREAMVQMQELTLEFYDNNWQSYPKWSDEKQYLAWRDKIESQIDGRWGPVSYMVAIVMQRQSGSKLMPEWEEAAATACAVQNMHLQASAEPGLACYWSSWHSGARDSKEMAEFLGMGENDKCLGLFMVARCDVTLKDSRRRTVATHGNAEWRA